MTIASFCHQLLLDQGTLSLEALADAASAAGVTTSSNPHQAVRNALRHTAVPLPGERWTAAVRLLEGRYLTTREFSAYDLALLEPACRQARLPLAQGGFVRFRHDNDGLSFPDRFVERQGLVALQILDGVLHLQDIDDSPDLTARGAAFAERLPERPRYGYDLTRKENERLWALLEQDPTLLREPTQPLSECLPFLQDLVRKERQRRAEHESVERDRYSKSYAWGTIKLPTSLMPIAEDAAHRAGLPLDSWVTQLVERQLGHTSAPPTASPVSGAKVIPFPNRFPQPASDRRIP